MAWGAQDNSVAAPYGVTLPSLAWSLPRENCHQNGQNLIKVNSVGRCIVHIVYKQYITRPGIDKVKPNVEEHFL